MYKLIITVSAQDDLEAIYEYIAVELANQPAAENFFDKVENCYDALIRQPYMYEECRDRRLHLSGYRRAVINKYIMIYRVDDRKKAIYITRFFYGARDYEKLI